MLVNISTIEEVACRARATAQDGDDDIVTGWSNAQGPRILRSTEAIRRIDSLNSVLPRGFDRPVYDRHGDRCDATRCSIILPRACSSRLLLYSGKHGPPIVAVMIPLSLLARFLD